MNHKAIALGALVLGVASVALFGLRQPDTASLLSACNAAVPVSIADAPLELKAMLDIACARAFVQTVEQDPTQIALAFGYPTILLEERAQDAVIEVMASGVQAGERASFANDREILSHLANLDQTATLHEISDFIRALQPNADLSGDREQARMLFMPVWPAGTNADRLLAYCEQADCQSDMGGCTMGPRLAEKLALVRQQVSLTELVKRCPITPEWVFGLRRAGVVDTMCSATLQLNAAAADSGVLVNGCFPPGVSLRDYDALTPNDAAAFVRLWVTEDMNRQVDARSLDYIRSYFPETAAFISDNMQSD